MMATCKLFECSVCKALFRGKPELAVHLNKTSPSCKTTPKIKRELPANRTESNAASSAGSASTLNDAALVAAMEAGMVMDKKTKPKKSGLETSILATIADGDEELVDAYSKISLDPATGAKQLTEEIVSSVTSKVKINVDRVADIVCRAKNVSVCFLLDTTRSMDAHISAVKEQIIDIVHRVQTTGCGIEGLAFVGYKDWSDGVNHFEVLPFTKSIPKFKAFVASVIAKGGGDFPEDVLGGLNEAIFLAWPQHSGTRIIFHLGDAPPHGKKKFHGQHRDDFEFGHPRDPSLQQLFREMRRKELIYFFGRINGECDKMISVFEKYYGQKIDMLDSTQVSNICKSVSESVMKSISVTYRAAAVNPNCSPIFKDKEMRPFTLEDGEPEWTRLPRQDGTILSLGMPESIDDITSFAKLEDKIKKCRLQISPSPFSKGSIRLAYYGKLFYPSSKDGASASKEIVDDVVFKEIISLPKVEDLDRQRYMTDLEVQTIAAKLAFEFNGKLSKTLQNPNVILKFLMTKVVRIFKTDATTKNQPYRFLAYEQRFRGASPTMTKYTNNIDFVLDPATLDDNGRKRLELAVAFSHFTYDITDGYLLVCDLQGVSYVDAKGKETLLLTDPAIHCTKHLRFGKTNLTFVGIDRFFKKHACNKYCQALGLKMPS